VGASLQLDGTPAFALTIHPLNRLSTLNPDAVRHWTALADANSIGGCSELRPKNAQAEARRMIDALQAALYGAPNRPEQIQGH
jgi:hypothetical protein